MIRQIHLSGFVAILFLASCAMSMTPMQVDKTLPTLTKSKYISQAQADEKVNNGTCRYMGKDRIYVAPIGISTKKDLKNGAQGIDEWVNVDAGNAYVLKNYHWVTVDGGNTQLTIEFDTMFCE